ncbi:MAG: right-handed parallel beta-helix repeat-containing protein [Candidatus Thorarchaeota archaeon]
MSSERVLETEDATRVLSYTPHGPILIQSNTDFETQGWSGEGSIENPYIIEDLEIDVEQHCVHIIDTSVYFSISDCEFIASIEATSATAVRFENVSHGIITQCNMTGNIGMVLDESKNLNISYNNFHSFAPIPDSYGLRVVESLNCSIRSNQFIGDGTGLDLHMSDNCSITNNEFYGCGFDFYEVHNPKTPDGHGLNLTNNLVNDKILKISEGLVDTTLDGSIYGQIWLFDCYNVSIVGGNFEEATRGVTFTNCENCSIVGSTISDCVITGIYFKESVQCKIIDCTVVQNGEIKPVEFWAGGIIIYGYSDYVILNSNISFNYGHGMFISGIDHCTINSSVFESNGGSSFTIESCSNFEIHHNTFNEDGLLIRGSLAQSIHSISDNTVNGKPLGYFVNISDTSIIGSDYGAIIIVNSTMVDIYNGNFSDTFFGIQVTYCISCNVRDFTIIGNRGYGIRISYSFLCKINSCVIRGGFHYGISLFESNNCSIEASIVHGCVRGVGVGLSNNTIIGNTIAYSDNTNLILGASSSANYICSNRFTWASDSSVLDYGTNNKFDDGISAGNYWSDYDGVGNYEVGGPAASIDYYPTVLTATSPATISTPDSITFEVGSAGYSFEWIVQSLYNATFKILENGSITQEGNVSTTPIVVQLDGLPAGIYLYENRVTDLFGEVASSWVLVTVTEESVITTTSTTITTTEPTSSPTTTPSEFDSTLFIFLGSGVTGAIVIVVLLLKIKRK